MQGLPRIVRELVWYPIGEYHRTHGTRQHGSDNPILPPEQIPSLPFALITHSPVLI